MDFRQITLTPTTRKPTFRELAEIVGIYLDGELRTAEGNNQPASLNETRRRVVMALDKADFRVTDFGDGTVKIEVDSKELGSLMSISIDPGLALLELELTKKVL